MKWQELLSRITGLSVPVFGISWDPPEAERTVAKRVLAALEDKRVLYRLAEYEYPDACEASVNDIRARLTDELGRLEVDTELAMSLRAMRASCRAFLDSVQDRGLAVSRIDQYPYPAKHWEFIEALQALRRILDTGWPLWPLATASISKVTYSRLFRHR